MGNRIQWVAGVLFSLAFVALLSIMNSSTVRYGVNVNNQINNTLSISSSYELQTFNETLVTGDTVISAINNRDTLSTNKLSIRVITDDGDESVYGEGGLDSYAASSVSDPRYIGPSQAFKASLSKNDNDVITQVEFVYTS